MDKRTHRRLPKVIYCMQSFKPPIDPNSQMGIKNRRKLNRRALSTWKDRRVAITKKKNICPGPSCPHRWIPLRRARPQLPRPDNAALPPIGLSDLGGPWGILVGLAMRALSCRRSGMGLEARGKPQCYQWGVQATEWLWIWFCG